MSDFMAKIAEVKTDCARTVKRCEDTEAKINIEGNSIKRLDDRLMALDSDFQKMSHSLQEMIGEQSSVFNQKNYEKDQSLTKIYSTLSEIDFWKSSIVKRKFDQLDEFLMKFNTSFEDVQKKVDMLQINKLDKQLHFDLEKKFLENQK